MIATIMAFYAREKEMNITIFTGQVESKRIDFGTERIIQALEEEGYEVSLRDLPSSYEDYRRIEGEKIYLGLEDDGFISWLEAQEILIYHNGKPGQEGFYLVTCPSRLTLIAGGDETGVLYGCLELIDRIREDRRVPREMAFSDQPVFKLRGPAVGLQKTKIEPPRKTYEYPVTEGRFPWFYDKVMWLELIDHLLEERANILYIWTGHPFSSFIKLQDYPEALEVDEATFEKNREVFHWLTSECEKRGIWVVLNFYNIHIPLPFAQHHGLELLQSSIHPLVADYTYKSIVEFMRSFPHIGLMIGLGEALRGNQNKTRWFIDTIIPAVKEGIKAAELAEEPPIILRGHDCDPVAAMTEAIPLYDNLYTMWKYNGEGLTTYFPRGKWLDQHRKLSDLGTTHIMNIHILADLEPFQFNAPLFIQKCVQASSARLGGNALHLYPLFYWDWPYAPDKCQPRIKQLDRDWIWFKAWYRYAWNPWRNERDEKLFWREVMAQAYGLTSNQGKKLLYAMESIGQCAPKILGRIGITEGNRQTMSLGMTMSQLTNVVKYRPNKELWYSVATKGEQPDDYVVNELRDDIHIGETPLDMVVDVEFLADEALRIMEELVEELKQGSKVSEEIQRIYTDVKAIYLMSYSYTNKVKAALKILEYKYTMDDDLRGDLSLLEDALEPMEKSYNYYKDLKDLTDTTYLYACSMQTRQRKIPFTDGDAFGHWNACEPLYRKELEAFKKNLSKLQHNQFPNDQVEVIEFEPLMEAQYRVLTQDAQAYVIGKKEEIFTDCDWKIQNVAEEINGLKGIRVGLGKAISEGAEIEIELMEDAKILLGYMGGGGVEWLKVPDLETNTHADDRGGLACVYANAIKAEGCPPVNIHALDYEKGRHKLYFGTGGYMIAGIIKKDSTIMTRNADLAGEGPDTLDWLYEEVE